MLAFNKVPVVITRTVSEYDGSGYPVVTTTTLLDGYRNVERIPFQRVYSITGDKQANAKAYYVLYLEVGDPKIPQQSTITFTMNGETYTGEIKFTQPMSEVVMNFNRECYFVSNNE